MFTPPTVGSNIRRGIIGLYFFVAFILLCLFGSLYYSHSVGVHTICPPNTKLHRMSRAHCLTPEGLDVPFTTQAYSVEEDFLRKLEMKDTFNEWVDGMWWLSVVIFILLMITLKL